MTPEDAEGSQDARHLLEPVSAQLTKLEILRRPSAFRASRSNAFGGSG